MLQSLDLLCRLNDMVVVDEDRFFFTNYWHTSLELEIAFGLQWGSIGFFNGTSSTLVVTGVMIPNGVVLSLDGRLVFTGHVCSLNNKTRCRQCCYIPTHSVAGKMRTRDALLQFYFTFFLLCVFDNCANSSFKHTTNAT